MHTLYRIYDQTSPTQPSNDNYPWGFIFTATQKLKKDFLAGNFMSSMDGWLLKNVDGRKNVDERILDRRVNAGSEQS
jgi:hypothetical protein